MWVIRAAQMKAFNEALNARFFTNLAVRAHRASPERFAAHLEPKAIDLIRRVAMRAVGYGVDAEDDVRAFVDLEIARGPLFEERLPFARALLLDGSLSGRVKMGLLRRRLEISE